MGLFHPKDHHYIRCKSFFATHSGLTVTTWAVFTEDDGLPMDFCDAGLVYLSTHLKIQCIATVDVRDFSVDRLPGNKRFVHVLDA